jgi:hypothetical protein
MNDSPGYKRPTGFDVMKRDIVNQIKMEKEQLKKEANIGLRLTRQLGLSEEDQPTEDTMRLLRNADRLGVTEPTRGYLDEHGNVLPARHAGHPFPPKASKKALPHPIDAMMEFGASMGHTTSHRPHPGGGNAGGGVSGRDFL